MGVLNTTPRTWVANEVVDQTELNTEIRDALTALQSAWTTYTPVLTNITLGNGSLTAAYHRWGKTIVARCQLQAGSTSSFSAGALGFSLPVSPNTAYTSVGGHPVGPAVVQPTSASSTRVGATAVITTSSVLNFLTDNLSASGTVTNLVPGTFANGALIGWTITYEAA